MNSPLFDQIPQFKDVKPEEEVCNSNYFFVRR